MRPELPPFFLRLTLAARESTRWGRRAPQHQFTHYVPVVWTRALDGTLSGDSLVARPPPALLVHSRGLSPRPASPCTSTAPAAAALSVVSCGTNTVNCSSIQAQAAPAGGRASSTSPRAEPELAIWLHETCNWLMGVGCEAAPYESTEVPWTPHPTTYCHLLKEVR